MAATLRASGVRAAVNLGAADGGEWEVRVLCDGRRARVAGGGVIADAILTSGRADVLARALGLVRKQG